MVQMNLIQLPSHTHTHISSGAVSKPILKRSALKGHYRGLLPEVKTEFPVTIYENSIFIHRCTHSSTLKNNKFTQQERCSQTKIIITQLIPFGFQRFHSLILTKLVSSLRRYTILVTVLMSTPLL